MIHGGLLDSIGLALFSLAWWGWLIGGGLAVVGMLFGVHVAVGAPEAQAYSSSSYTLEESAARGDIGAMAQLQQQSQPGYTGPASDPMQPSYEQQVYDDFNRGDISSLQQYEQQKFQNAPKAGPETRPLTQQEIAERDATKAAEDAEWAAYQAEWAQYEKDLAAWEAQYGSGASGGGGGSAPAAPGPSANQYVALDSSKLSELFPDPYDYSTHVQPDPSTTDYAEYYQLMYEAQRQSDAGKPLSADMRTYQDRLEQEVKLPNDGVNGAAAQRLAKDATQGTIEQHPDLTSAIVATKAKIAMYEAQKEEHPDIENAYVLVTAQYLLAELEAEYTKQQAIAQGPVVAYKAKGAQVDPTYTDGGHFPTLDIAMKSKARAGSTVKIQVMEYNADKGRMVVVDTTKAKVSKGGKIQAEVQAHPGDVIMVKKNTGKKLAQIEIPGQ